MLKESNLNMHKPHISDKQTKKIKPGQCMHFYGAPEGTRKLKSFEWLDCTNNSFECRDCTNNKVLNVAIAQTIKF